MDIKNKIMFITKVLVQTLEININHLTPIVAFLLVKKIKMILQNAKKQSQSNENRIPEAGPILNHMN
jgi:hypothetical protein